MSDSTSVQASITDRLDTVIAAIIAQGLKPAAIYLTSTDYELFKAEEAAYWREELGIEVAAALSYRDVPRISESLIDKYELPVRQRTTLRTIKSTVYASNGSPFPLWVEGVLNEA